jgi:hypothetical protein
MGTILKIPRKTLYLTKVDLMLEAVRAAIPERMYIQVLFSSLDLAFTRLALDFLSLQLKIPSQVVQLKKNLATACKPSRKACSGSRGNCLASYASSPSHQSGRACTINSLGRRPLSASSLVNLLTVADHEQVRNLPMPGKWPQRRACVPDWSRKRDRPVVSARRNDRDRARCRGGHRSGIRSDR